MLKNNNGSNKIALKRKKVVKKKESVYKIRSKSRIVLSIAGIIIFLLICITELASVGLTAPKGKVLGAFQSLTHQYR